MKIKAQITLNLDDGSKEEMVINTDSWEHLIADIELAAKGQKEKEKHFIKLEEEEDYQELRDREIEHDSIMDAIEDNK